MSQQLANHFFLECVIIYANDNLFKFIIIEIYKSGKQKLYRNVIIYI